MTRLLAFAALVIAANGVGPAAASTEANKAVVAELYARVFNEHDLTVAERLLAPGYIQHHPGIPSGRDAFVKAFSGYFAAAPGVSVDVRRTVAEGDLVVVHSLWKDGPADPGSAVVDIFRVQDGRIAEHWDVAQPIDPKMKNPDLLF